MRSWRLGKPTVSYLKIIGHITPQVAALLNISLPVDSNIYLGASNLRHMKASHPADFTKYGNDLIAILAYPDYVGMNPSDGSIEYVKELLVDGEYVKVAVRLSGTGRYYARSLYVLNPKRTQNYIAKGTLKRLDRALSL